MNPSFGSRERRSRTTLSRGSRMAQFQGFRQGQRRRSLFLHSVGIILFFVRQRSTRALRERVERHSQCARGLWVRVDTRRLEDVRKGRASETGQLHGSRGRCPRAREVRALFRNSDACLFSVVCLLQTTSFAALEPRGRTRAGGGRSSRRASTSRPRLVSRTDSSGTESIVPRSPRPEPPPPGRTCRLSSAAFRLHRGRHCDVVLFTK